MRKLQPDISAGSTASTPGAQQAEKCDTLSVCVFGLFFISFNKSSSEGQRQQLNKKEERLEFSSGQKYSESFDLQRSLAVWPSALIVFSTRTLANANKFLSFFIYFYSCLRSVLSQSDKCLVGKMLAQKDKKKCHSSNSGTTLFQQLIIQTVTFCQVSRSGAPQHSLC